MYIYIYIMYIYIYIYIYNLETIVHLIRAALRNHPTAFCLLLCEPDESCNR